MDLKFETIPEPSGDANSVSSESSLAGLRLQSPVAASGPGPGRYAGMFYCTLLSKAQAFEYIMYGSQRGDGIAASSAAQDVEGRVGGGAVADVRVAAAYA